MRKLKYHQAKLLKKVNFYDWKVQADRRQSRIMHRYHLQDRQDYSNYNKICGQITSVINKIKKLPQDDAFRIRATEELMEKLYSMGLLNSRENIGSAQKMAVSAFCRRRLAVLLCTMKFAQTMREAITFIEQGHIKVGVQVITEPSFIVTRNLQDHIGWVDSSSIKKKILQYNNKFDDYDMMN